MRDGHEISGYLSVKEPRTGALDWHQDWWCWDHPVSFEEPAPLNRTPPAWRVAA
jgi:hypothetical protein